jgi:CheY-like chemotaxis protein
MSEAEAERPETLVLVADDDADVRELVVFRLERAGYEVVTAGDGEEALELARDRSPDVCLIDVMMPGLDGYELTERLRGSPETARSLIVLLTASVQETAVQRGFDAGADDYVKKPFSPTELVERLAAALERR